MSEFTTSDAFANATGARPTDRIEYTVAEHNGTPVLALRADGTLVENHRTFPNGESWQKGPNPNFAQAFTTYDRDADTHLDYAMARHYASTEGRFMTPDPGHVGANIYEPQSLNAYAYVSNDPINAIDPDGLCERKIGDRTPCSLWEQGMDAASNALNTTLNAANAYLSAPRDPKCVARFAGVGATAGVVFGGTVGAIGGAAAGGTGGSVVPILGTVAGAGAGGVAGGSAGAVKGGAIGGLAGGYLGAAVCLQGPPMFFAKSKDKPHANNSNNDSFDAAVREIERRIGKKLTRDQIRRLHEHITHQGYSFWELVEEGVALFQ
jgi:RHS repeat-associated protein